MMPSPLPLGHFRREIKKLKTARRVLFLSVFPEEGKKKRTKGTATAARYYPHSLKVGTQDLAVLGEHTASHPTPESKPLDRSPLLVLRGK